MSVRGIKRGSSPFARIVPGARVLCHKTFLAVVAICSLVLGGMQWEGAPSLAKVWLTTHNLCSFLLVVFGSAGRTVAGQRISAPLRFLRYRAATLES